MIGKKENEIDNSLTNINEKVKELHKIFSTTSGKKGKISELALENVLTEYFSKSENFWTKNLQIGKGIVEFAIKLSRESEKWIPVDSKSLIPKMDDNDEWIIDHSYITSIKTDAKKISEKYLGKNNTASFGIMVLPTQEVLNILYHDYPSELYEIAEKFNVYLSSPYGFSQYINTIKNLDENIKKIKSQNETIDKIKTVVGHIRKFNSASEESLEKMKVAFDTHLKNINKKMEEIDEQV